MLSIEYPAIGVGVGIALGGRIWGRRHCPPSDENGDYGSQQSHGGDSDEHARIAVDVQCLMRLHGIYSSDISGQKPTTSIQFGWSCYLAVVVSAGLTAVQRFKHKSALLSNVGFWN
jgi:hypothetical protein